MKRFILARWQDFTRAFTGWTGVALAALLGAVLGVGVFTVFYSGSTEYLGDDAPHNDIVYKYINKADNGFWHALKFTFQNYPENIKIRDHNREIVEAACIDCHGDYVDQAKNSSEHKGERMSCLRCHDGVGHKR